MEDLGRVIIQWLHVTAGVMWIGGGFYTLLVQLPALLAAPPQARGPVSAELAPRQIRYILRLAELTIATGIANLIVTGRAGELTAPLGSRWAGAIGLGIVLAIVLYGIVRAVVKPAVERMLALGPKAAAGDPAAPAEIGRIIERIKRTGYAQIVIGLAIIFLMVLARFS